MSIHRDSPLRDAHTQKTRNRPQNCEQRTVAIRVETLSQERILTLKFVEMNLFVSFFLHVN